MRIIKFRAKRVDNKEWVYGNLVQYNNCCYILINPEIELDEGYWEHSYGYPPSAEDFHIKEMHEVIPKTVGQFINQYDIHKEELYEGDVVFYEDHEWEVVFKYDRWDMKNGYKYVRDDDLSDDPGFTQWEQSWKIGNIHDNPELLK